MILIFILHALFAAIFPLARIAVRTADPIFFTGIRMIIAGSFLLIYQFLRYKYIFPQWKKYIWHLIVLSIFNIFLTNAPEFWSLKYLISSKASFIYSICPFLAAIYAYFLFDEKITKKKMLGMLTGALGLIIMLSNETKAEQAIGGILFLSWPELAVIGAALSTVYGWTAMRQLMKHKACSPLVANGISMFFGGILSLAISPIFENWNPIPIYNYPGFIEILIIITLISNIICYNLYGYLLNFYTSTLVSFVGFVEPIFAALYGWILLGEVVSWQFYIASLTVLTGLYLFYSEELKQGYITKP